MDRWRISLRHGALFIVAILLISGCVSQQKKTAEPAVSRPQSSQSDPSPSQKADKQPRTTPEAGPTKPAAGQQADKSAEIQLQAAREKLIISQQTEKRVQAEFEALKQSGQASAEVTKDYETYLDRIRGLVAENRKMVEKLEGAMAASPAGDNSQGADKGGTVETAQLDRQLNQSLSDFDHMLLEEMEKIQAQSERKMTSLAEEAAAAAERLRKKGIDVGSAEGEETETAEKDAPGGESGQTAEGSQEGRDTETETGMTESEQAKTDTGGDAGGKQTNDRRGAYSEDDDDIVARQLREAAEKETDPELKKKLWKEYEDYKRNTSQ